MKKIGYKGALTYEKSTRISLLNIKGSILKKIFFFIYVLANTASVSILFNSSHMCAFIYIQCITKVSTPLTFLQIFKYISSWDNTDKMTLWHKILREFFIMWCHVGTFSDQYERVWELHYWFEHTYPLCTWA